MSKFKEYADIKAKIAELTELARAIERDVIDELLDIDGNKLEADFATFSLYSKPKWQYSDDLTTKERQVKNKIKMLKKAEESDGKAIKISDGVILRCQIRVGK